MPELIVIYGPPLTGKSTLAREVARALDGKTAVVSTDALLEDAIVNHDGDAYAELEMVHTQARLLAANYLKSRYNVVLEGAFGYLRDGVLHRHDQEIDQILALMRNLASSPLVVRLTAREDTLRRRAATASRPRDLQTVLDVEPAYRQRYGSRTLVVSTDDESPQTLTDEVLKRLKAE